METITGARWLRVFDLFEEALDRNPTDRSAWLAQQCNGDEAMLGRVEDMLAAHERQTGVLEVSLDTLSFGEAVANAGAPAAGDERIGRYRVMGEIGRGGMGVVYQAEDPQLGRYVALKFLPPYLTGDEQAKQRFLVEARAASKLDHPRICTVHDIGETEDGRLYFAMAFYEGETLAARLESGAISVEESIGIARQIAEGLAHAHEAGVIHRDVKPSNVFITASGDVKILDFGLAKMEFTNVSDPGSRVGTMAYMSPEQTHGAEIDHRTDLWSLGVTLYEMLTGRLPFPGGRQPAVLYQILHGDPEPLPPEVPGWVADVVTRLLSKAREDRYRTASEALEALSAGPGTGASPSVGRAHRNFPDYLTSFVGREREIADVRRLLDSSRLLTLTGPGGAGKTRLSLTLAREAAPGFRDGACFVPLAPIDDASLVATAIARALDIPESAGIPVLENLKNALRSRELLLVLDNFEQVLDAGPVVRELLGNGVGLKVVVTSRAALHISGEQEYPVPPLEVPQEAEKLAVDEAERHSAVRLFVERARAARPDFELSPENTADVARLCGRLDGLPLAIELAAARIKLFSPQALLNRLGERLDLLRGGGRDQPARHRTLRQAIAWSYDLLDEHAQHFFRRMSIFSGGWTLEASEALCAGCEELETHPFDLLCSLTDHSLVRQTDGPDGEPRFWMLETIRAYGRELLAEAGELDSTGAAHSEYFLAFAERAEPELTGADQVRWLDRLEADHDNIRAVFTWAQSVGRSDVGVKLAASLWRFWIARGYMHEGRPRLEALLADPASKTAPGRGRALNGLATLCHYAGDYVRSREVLEECLSLARERDDRATVALALNSLGWVYCLVGDMEAARRFSKEALLINEALGKKRDAALSLNNIGWAANLQGNYREAQSCLSRSLELRREIRDQRGIGFALANLAWAEQYHGNLDGASALLDEAREILRPVHDNILASWAQVVRGRIARDRGDLEGAARIFEEGLAISTTSGNPVLNAWLMTLLGAVVREAGDIERGGGLLASAMKIWRRVECPWGIAINLLEQARWRVSTDISRAASLAQESLAIFTKLPDHRGVAEALETLAELDLARGDAASADAKLAEAAKIRTAIEAPRPLAATRPGSPDSRSPGQT